MLGSTRALDRRLRDEGGFTFPELAVSMVVTLVIVGAVSGFISLSMRQHSDQGDRVSATDDARNAMLRMTNEIRDAGAVTFVNGRTVQAAVRQADGSYHQTTFSCTAAGATSSCSRTDAVTGQTQKLVDDVVNTNNFALVAGSTLSGTGSDGGAIQVLLQLDLPDASNPVTLSSAVRPRNCSNTSGVVNPC